MTKKKSIDLENELFENIEDITIEEIDKEINDFYIDKEKIENIKYSFDKESIIKNSIDRAEDDMTKSKLKKRYIKIAASLVILISMGVYSPALAYYVPPVMKVLEKINDTLKIDEITSAIELDTIIPKAVVVENKIHFVKYGVVDFIHKMSNQIINPVDGKKFGIIQITPDNIKIALNSIENINNDEARNYLKEELTKWKNGDFTNAVQVHNYVWHMLDGEIGIASSLDEQEINKIKEKYFK